MTVKQIRAFLAVAQTLSFAQACDRLHLSQSALSLSIKALEENLGGALFSRTTGHVRLTPEGKSLLPLARRLIADWEDAEDQLRQRFKLQQGRVAVAAMPSYAGNLLPLILKLFRERFPNVSVTVHDVINEQVIEMLQNRRVELGIAFEPYATTTMKFSPLILDRFVAVVPPDSSLVERTGVKWNRLLKEPFIALQRPSTVRFMLEACLRERGLELPVMFESHQLATVGRMVASGLGVSAVPSICIDQMHELGARCLTLYDPIIERSLGILTQKDHELSVAAQELFETLIEYNHLNN